MTTPFNLSKFEAERATSPVGYWTIAGVNALSAIALFWLAIV
jgi:hypothetical protein